MIKIVRNLTLIAILSGIPVCAMENTQEPRKPVPLKNIGSSCFMNAAVQVVYAGMHEITSLLFKQGHVYRKDCLSSLYMDLLPAFMFSEIPKEGYDPEKFCYMGWEQLQDSPYKQADANEFLLELLRCLTYKDVTQEALPQLARHDGPMELSTDLSRLFYVRTESTSYADLGELGTVETDPQHEYLPCLSLPVLAEHKTLKDCLKSYFMAAGENVPSEYGPVAGERHTFLEGTARYVLCCLNRRGFLEKENDQKAPTYTRQDNPISFDLYHQSFAEYYKNPEHNTGEYELIGVIMHSGSANCGHYTSYIKSGNDWYYCNDETITPISEEDVYTIGQQGYGVNKNTLPTTLVYEHSASRGTFPARRWLPPQPVARAEAQQKPVSRPSSYYGTKGNSVLKPQTNKGRGTQAGRK